MTIPKRSVKVPLDLVEAIDKFIAKSKGVYRSRPEVASAALIKFLKVKRRKRKWKK